MEKELLLRTPDQQQHKQARKWLQLLGLLSLLLGYVQISQAQTTIKSAKSGPWDDQSTWAGARIPGATDAVELIEGHQVTVAGQVTCSSLELVPPPNNDKNYYKTELVVAQGATFTATSVNLNSKNDRRYTSLVNNGAIVALNTLIVGKGSVVDNTTGTLAVAGSITNNGDITTGSATLEIGGTYGGAGIFTKGTGTVTYNSPASQSIADLAYHHLTLTGGSTKTPLANLQVSGNLLIAPATTFRAGTYGHTITGDIRNGGILSSDAAQFSSIAVGGSMINTGTIEAGAATYNISGNWSNAGTFQAGTSTVALQGNTLQSISGDNTFYNLNFSGTAKAQLLQDVSVKNGIGVANSHLLTGANSIWLGTSAYLTTSETDAAHIIGTVKTSRTLTATAPEDFGRIGLTLTRNDVDPGVITVERQTGVATEIMDGTESITRQYNISRAGSNDVTALSMTMDLAFLPNELASKPLNEYKLYNKNQNQDALPVQSSVVNQTTLRHTNSNRFGTFTLAPPIMPMPVELVWFKATRQQQAVVLQWKTASEQGNQGFEVQVSADGRTFRPIGFVTSNSPDSRVVQLYTFTDNKPNHRATSYYRLMQQDYSGQVSYSKIQAVGAAKAVTVFQASPNPFKEHITFALNTATPLEVRLTDLAGRTVLQQQLSTNNLGADGYYRLDTSSLSSGSVYLLTINTPDQVYQARLLRQ